MCEGNFVAIDDDRVLGRRLGKLVCIVKSIRAGPVSGVRCIVLIPVVGSATVFECPLMCINLRAVTETPRYNVAALYFKGTDSEKSNHLSNWENDSAREIENNNCIDILKTGISHMFYKPKTKATPNASINVDDDSSDAGPSVREKPQHYDKRKAPAIPKPSAPPPRKARKADTSIGNSAGSSNAWSSADVGGSSERSELDEAMDFLANMHGGLWPLLFSATLVLSQTLCHKIKRERS